LLRQNAFIQPFCNYIGAALVRVDTSSATLDLAMATLDLAMATLDLAMATFD